MSQDKFTVPAKTPAAPKKETEKKASSTTKKKTSTTGGAKKTASTAAKEPAKKKAPSTAKKTQASTSTKPKTANSSTKLENAKVKSQTVRQHRQLPDVPDMGNMTREERIEAVMGIKKERPREKKESTVEEQSARYESMKSQIARAKSEVKKETVAPPVAKKDWTGTAMRLALVMLVFILILIALILRSRRGRAAVPAVETPIEIVHEVPQPVALSGEVEIRAGMGARTATELFAPYVDSTALLSLLEEKNLLSSIQAGVYSVSSDMTVEEVAALITARQTSSLLVVYPAYTIEDIDRLLANRGLAESGDFIEAAGQVAEDYGLAFAEGYFMGGSYLYSDPYTLATDMLSATLAVVKEEGAALMESGLSLDALVTISSMVNRETQDESQMPTIAAIILNRLAVDMPLGIDATTRYEIGNWTDPVPQSVYETITPYNTRRKAGLPPSGIGAVGKAALIAVLHPADTEDLFYLHGEDGKLYTSPDYETHLVTYGQLH